MSSQYGREGGGGRCVLLLSGAHGLKREIRFGPQVWSGRCLGRPEVRVRELDSRRCVVDGGDRQRSDDTRRRVLPSIAADAQSAGRVHTGQMSPAAPRHPRSLTCGAV